MSDEQKCCESCKHPLSEHFRDVTGTVRCLHSDSGYSTSGIIGVPWTMRCDCADMISARSVQREAEKQKERERFRKSVSDYVARKAQRGTP
jgi:hypothetical protein